MKYILSLLVLSLFFLTANAQDCFVRLQNAFDNRGANPVLDGMHKNVFISFFEDETSRCISGKVRVENNKIENIFLQIDDNTYELMNVKFYNAEKKQPTIKNGISEMIYTIEGEIFKVIFIDLLKPKK